MASCADQPILSTLISLFFSSSEPLGRFHEVPAEEVPEPYHALLAHEHHMTVTVERYHGDCVDVQVLRKQISPTHYAREILLTCQGDGEVVLYGIMRIRLDCLAPEVRSEIESETSPLGHVLIRHNVLREIHLRRLWRVEPGDRLQEIFGCDAQATTFGRTAIIDLDGEPAVELIEIVSPK